MKTISKVMKKMNQKGVALLFAMISMALIAAIGIAMVTSANINSTSARNYKNKIGAFYAADGQMTLLAQQVLDSNEMIYLKDSLAMHTNIGSSTDPPTSIGSYSVSSGVHTITGSGTDIWSSTHGHFAYDTITGDILVMVYVQSLTTNASVPKAGIFICDSIAEITPYAYVFFSPTRGILFETSTGYTNCGSSSATLPVYLRLQKTGPIFTAGYSTDGTTWTGVGSAQSISMSLPCLAGLAVTSHNNGSWATGIFSKLQGLACMGSGTANVGSFSVNWTLAMSGSNSFDLTTKAYNTVSKWGAVYQTPLKQFIQRQGGGLYNPYGDTAMLPVTFYDFHSDRTNPEFEQPHSNKTVFCTGMVQDTLDSERKPLVRLPANGGHPHTNYYIKKWFRDWTTYGQGDSTIPIYQYTTLQYNAKHHTQLSRWKYRAFGTDTIPPQDHWGSCNCGEFGVDDSTFLGIDTAVNRNDTPFKNIVIQDTLPFIMDSITLKPGSSSKVPKGTYHYCAFDTGGMGATVTTFESQHYHGPFFRLDHKGFCHNNTNDTEWYEYWRIPANNHNYSYTMEIKRSFVMVDSLFFQFVGDDDCWLYLDNRLALDMGGEHAKFTGYIKVDTFGQHTTRLQDNHTYNFDFFYCERHSTGSDIEIMTNLLKYIPTTTRQRHWSRDYGITY